MRFDAGMLEYSQITDSVKITVTPIYMEDESIIDENYFIWTYNIIIENQGDKPVQLISRYWHITDGNGDVKEVRGSGVIGLQPTIKPSDKFEYNSGVQLNTASGMMEGFYEMVLEDGTLFKALIPAFSLDSDLQLARPN